MANNPPAQPPPPPPGEKHGEADPFLPPSYQRQSSGSSKGRAADLPTIRNYGEETRSEDPRDFFFVRGDPSLRPNTGETNSYDTAIFGLALHEILENIRLANMIAALVAIGLLVMSWFLRLMTGQIASLVLSSYLAFLSFVLLLVELVGMYHVARVDEWLKENFGLLRHPVGKTVYLFMLSTLCFGIQGLPEFILGGLYFVCAFLILYVWVMYPEFRKNFADDDGDDDDRDALTSSVTFQSVGWSDFATSSFFMSARTSLGEQASLLGSSMRKN